MAAQKKKHDDNQLRGLFDSHRTKECPACGQIKARVKESRKVFEGVRRRYTCFGCDHKYTTYEVTSDVYEELRSLRSKLNKLREVFDGVCPPLSPTVKPTVEVFETNEIPCCDCVHLTPYGCSFDIPEAQTDAARGCNLFKHVFSDNMLT